MIGLLGDSGLMLPAAGIITTWLIAARAWYFALRWTSFFAMGVCMVVISKIAFLSWGIGVRALNFTSISGHTMLAATVFPIAAHLLFLETRRDLRMIGIISGGAIAVAVGLSRYMLGAHSPSEIIAGFGVGAWVVAIVVWPSKCMEKLALRPVTLGVALIVAGSLTYGHGLEIQHLIVKMSLDVSGRDHLFSRRSWQQTNAPGLVKPGK
jgi:membrane-associated phospholipid phosphatase